MIQLDYRDNRPVYEQIKEKIKELIILRALKENDKILSVREMSTALTINPNTILKAYKELENEGYIYSVKGKGYFVSDNKMTAKSVDTKHLYQQAETALRELYFLGESKAEILNTIEKIWEGSKND